MDSSYFCPYHSGLPPRHWGNFMIAKTLESSHNRRCTIKNLGPVLWRRNYVHAYISANGRAAFKWKLPCHRLKGMRQCHVPVVMLWLILPVTLRVTEVSTCSSGALGRVRRHMNGCSCQSERTVSRNTWNRRGRDASDQSLTRCSCEMYLKYEP